MIKENQRLLNRVNVVTDAVAALAAVKGMSAQEMTDLTAGNACRLFDIPKK